MKDYNINNLNNVTMKYKVFINGNKLSYESDSLSKALKHAKSKAKNQRNYVELWYEDTIVNYWN